MSPREFFFGDRRVASDEPVFCIAELSGNHQGSLAKAKDMVRAAADSGADAVKTQTYTADSITLNCSAPPFIAEGAWKGRTLYDLYSEGSMPWDWQAELAELAAERGIKYFSSAFDPSSIDYLESIDVLAYKVASFEIVDTPLIARAAATAKPLIISTGMATLGEIERAVAAAKGTAIALLVCTSSYPAPAREANLARIPHLADAFDVPTGLSDHTLGNEVAIAAATLGATIIEKHFTLRRADGGVDSSFSLEPAEFAEMVRSVQAAREAVGAVRYGPTEAELGNRSFRRSLFVARHVPAGNVISEADVRSVRPSGGLDPRHLDAVLGRRAVRDLTQGEPADWSMFTHG